MGHFPCLLSSASRPYWLPAESPGSVSAHVSSATLREERGNAIRPGTLGKHGELCAREAHTDRVSSSGPRSSTSLSLSPPENIVPFHSQDKADTASNIAPSVDQTLSPQGTSWLHPCRGTCRSRPCRKRSAPGWKPRASEAFPEVATSHDNAVEPAGPRLPPQPQPQRGC